MTNEFSHQKKGYQKRRSIGSRFVFIICLLPLSLWLNLSASEADFRLPWQDLARQLSAADSLKDVKPDSSLFIINALLEAENSNTSSDDLLDLYSLKSYVLVRLGQFEEASVITETTLDLARKNSSYFHEANAFLRKGTIGLYLTEYEEAIGHFQEAIDIANKIDDEEIQIGALMNLGVISWYQKLFTKAKDYYEDALTLAVKNGIENRAASLRSNIGGIESQLGNFGSAISYYLDAFEYFQKTGNEFAIGVTHTNLGFAYLKTRDYLRAEYHTIEALKINKAQSNVATQARTNNNLAIIHMEQANWEDATRYGEEAVRLAEMGKLNEDRRLAYETLYNTYKRSGRYELSLTYFEQYQQLKDSLQTQSETEIAEEAIANYKKSEERVSASSKDGVLKDNALIAALAIIATILGITSISFYLRNRRAMVGSTSIAEDDKNEESNLNSEATQVNSKDQTEYDLLSKLGINERIVKSLQIEDGFNDKSWAKFLLLFNTVYPGFHNQLMERHGGLTANEVRICVLTKLGLLNHEVADLLNISTDSVRKAKYRLSKKMMINSSEELTTYLGRY